MSNSVQTTRPADTLQRRSPASDKILDHHLDRLAMVYVRQSTQHQVLEHRESTARQYALTDRAEEFGWSAGRVEVIDDDQGISGSSIVGREGFQRLLAEISADRVGIVLGLEMSRLARSCKDWHTLLELCAIYRVLLADADGLYDPANHNDRLLLGLKGTMSEAELHILKTRMHQGMWNKAERGEVLNHPPIGYSAASKARDGAGDYVIDPDAQVQEVVRLVFEQFERLGSINALLRWMVSHDIKMPVRPHFGSERGELTWRRPNRVTLNNMLHHPIYAGAYRWGHREVDARKKSCRTPDDRTNAEVARGLPRVDSRSLRCLHRLGDIRANPAKTAGKQPFGNDNVRATTWAERVGRIGRLWSLRPSDAGSICQHSQRESKRFAALQLPA